jgi:hypothetical protein
MYEFLHSIEVTSCLYPKQMQESLREENVTKNVSDVLNDLFLDDADEKSKLTLVSSKGDDHHFEKKSFNIDYLRQRKKKMEMKSVLIKGYYLIKKSSQDSSRIPISLKLSKFRWQRKPWVLILFQDITDHEENKALKELDKLKDKLLASVTHDLRTPLNMVIGDFWLIL